MNRTVAHYKILSRLGEGGMGSVYRAVDQMLDRPVAIKVMHAQIAHDPGLLERFRSEASLLARLHDRNIAAVYSFFREGDEFFLVMELVEGQSLAVLMQSTSPPTQEQSIAFVSQLLSGLQHAHASGVLHRDIKPGNILITPDGTAKITDFGIARAAGAERQTRDLRVVGTPEYLAPERIQGQPGDARADLYAVGVVLYSLLAQRLPFHSQSDFELMRAHLEQTPPPLHGPLDDVSPAVEAVVLRALAKRPDDRFSSAAEMREALLAAAAQPVPSSTDFQTPVSPWPATRFVEPLLPATPTAVHPTQTPFQWRWVAIGGAALLALALVLLASRPSPQTSPAPAELAARSARQTIAPAAASLLPPPQSQTSRSVAPVALLPGLSARKLDAVASQPDAAAQLPSKTATRESDDHRALGSVQTLRDVRKIYIEKMPNGLNGYLGAAISNRLGRFLVVVLDRPAADAILQNDPSSPGTVNLVDPSGRVVYWSGRANDREKAFLNFKHGGEREVAEKLVGQLHHALL